MVDPEFLCLHKTIVGIYGSATHRNLNALTMLLCKTAVTAAGLQFLLSWRREGLFLNFVNASINFAHRGPNLHRLATKLRIRILRASIRDSRERIWELQKEVDRCWIALFDKVTDERLWSNLVGQKDHFFANWKLSMDRRLRVKLNALRTRSHQNNVLDAPPRPRTETFRCQTEHIQNQPAQTPSLCMANDSKSSDLDFEHSLDASAQSTNAEQFVERRRIESSEGHCEQTVTCSATVYGERDGYGPVCHPADDLLGLPDQPNQTALEMDHSGLDLPADEVAEWDRILDRLPNGAPIDPVPT